MADTTAALIERLRERHVSHHGDGYEPPFVNRDGPEAADLIEALSVPAAGYVLVPVEPTEAMVSAGMSEIDWCRDEQVQDKFRPFLKLNQDGSSYSGTSPGEDVRDTYRAMIAAALAAQPSAGALDIAWVWTKKGSDTDGDPIIFDGTFGDYRSRVVLSRTDRSWSAVVNNGHGKSDMPSEHAAMAYAEETVAKLLKSRLEKARECVALYATTAQPDTGDVAALREALGQIKDEIRFSGAPGDKTLAVIEGLIDAALSKPHAPGREG